MNIEDYNKTSLLEDGEKGKYMSLLKDVTRYDCIIAVDPDKEKSGVATVSTGTDASFTACAMTFPLLMEMLAGYKGKSVLLVVEAGWMVRKSCFHEAQGRGAEKIAKDVGANHETGRKIIEMAEHYGIRTVAVHPLKKGWAGADGKISHEELEQFTGSKVPRCNQDVRDALLIAWLYSGHRTGRVTVEPQRQDKGGKRRQSPTEEAREEYRRLFNKRQMELFPDGGILSNRRRHG